MKWIIHTILLLFLFIGTRASAQVKSDKTYYLVDSLNMDQYTDEDKQLLEDALTKYHSAKHDTDRLNALELITENMIHDDWTKFNLLVKEESIQYLKNTQDESVQKRLLESLAGALNNIGVNYQQKGKIAEAIKYFHKSLKYQEQVGDKYGTATALNNIGAIYNDQGNYDKALEYLLKGLTIREQIGSKKGIAQSLNNVGSIYYKLTDFPKALSYFKKSLMLYEEIDDKEGMAYSYSNIGNVYDNQNLPFGLSFHLRSLKIREEIGDKKGQAYALHNIGESLLKDGKTDEALKYAKKCFEISMETGYHENTQLATNLLSKIYKKKNNYKEGWEMYELFISLRDSINNETNKKIALDQDTKYKFEKEQAVREAEYKKELEVIAEKEQKQKVISFAVAGGLILVLIFSIIVVSRLKITRQQKEVIEEQKLLVDIKNKEITDSITYAKRIQEAILPPASTLKELLKNGFVLYKPKDIVAGDFYWVESIPDPSKGGGQSPFPLGRVGDGLVLFAAADCTGHGVPGAMVSVVCHNALNRAVREYHLTEPAKILDKVRELVIETFEKSDQEVKDGMDIALCSINFNTKKLAFAGANNPLYIVRKGELLETKGDKQSIGRFAGSNPYQQHEMDLEKDDTIYVFTDGYPDQFGGENLPAGRHGGKKFKYKQLKEVLASIQQHDMEKQQEIIDSTFNNWKGDLEQIDDVLMIGVKI